MRINFILGVYIAASAIITLPTNSAAHQVVADSFCAKSNEKLVVHTIIEYNYLEKRNKKFRELWEINCLLVSQNCRAARIDLKNFDAGSPINFFDFVIDIDMKIVSIQGGVYTIAWGPFRVFTVDLVRNKVGFRESSEELNAIGEGRCK